MVGTGLAGGVRRTWLVGGGFSEKLFGTFKVSINFISRNMMESETGFTRIVERQPIVTSSFQQSIGADDIGLDEFRRTRDGAIDMRLCSQVHDGVRLVLAQNPIDLFTVTNINTLEYISRILADSCQGLKVARISELIDVNDRIGSVGNDMTDDCRADKSGAAGY
ncbi:hypothetical protein D3C76_861890 [compost metagenome]